MIVIDDDDDDDDDDDTSSASFSPPRPSSHHRSIHAESSIEDPGDPSDDDDTELETPNPSVVFCNHVRHVVDDDMADDTDVGMPDLGISFHSSETEFSSNPSDVDDLDVFDDADDDCSEQTPPLNYSFRGTSNPRDPRLNQDVPNRDDVSAPLLRGSPVGESDSPSPARKKKKRGPNRHKTYDVTKRSGVCDPDNIAFSITSICCSSRCVWFFTPNELLNARTFYTNMSLYDASKWLLTLIQAFYNPVSQLVELQISGHPLCLTAFLLYHGISRSKWYAIRKTFLSGGTDFLHGNTCSTTRLTPQTDIITDWINVVVHCQGDPSPNSNDIYLPMSIVKCVMYEAFVDDCTHDLSLALDQIPSNYMFLKIWREDFDHVKWPKYTKLGKCDVCTKIAVALSHCNPITKRELRAKKKYHLQQNALDRGSLSQRTALALRDPTVTLCLDQDYANQLRLPHQRNVPKSWLSKCHRPRLQIGGLIDHGNPGRFLFLHFGWYIHDPNLSLTHLYCHLADLRARGLSSSTFCLQADNCYKENKNKTTFAFLTLLVMQGWFDQIEMYFLSPGHTHGEVDRMFSRFGHLRKQHNCDTPAEFMTKWYKLAYRNPTRMPKLKIVQFVYNWKAYFHGHYHENIQGHSRPRAFLFKKNPLNGIVQFWAKESALSPSWIGRSDDNLHGWEIFFSVPTGLVGIIRPVPLPEEKYRDVRKTYDWLSPEARIWWEHFRENQFFWLPEETEPPRGNVWDVDLQGTVDTPSVFVPAPITFNIRMSDHPPSSLDEIKIGALLAVIPPDPNNPPSSDEDELTHLDLEEDMDDCHNEPRVQNLNEEAHPYWIGKVVGFSEHPTTGVRKAVVRYYKRRLNTPDDRKYLLHHSRGGCLLGSILLHGFTFTQTGLLRSSTINKLKRILHL